MLFQKYPHLLRPMFVALEDNTLSAGMSISDLIVDTILCTFDRLHSEAGLHKGAVSFFSRYLLHGVEGKLSYYENKNFGMV